MLTEAAIRGATDRLVGLKENVVIGRLIPARCQLSDEVPISVAEEGAEGHDDQESSLIAIKVNEAEEAELAI